MLPSLFHQSLSGRFALLAQFVPRFTILSFGLRRKKTTTKTFLSVWRNELSRRFLDEWCVRMNFFLQESDFFPLAWKEEKQNWKQCLEMISFVLQQWEELLHEAAAPNLHASLKQLAAAIFKRAAAAGLIVTERQAFGCTCTCTSTFITAQQDDFCPKKKKKSTPSSNPQGSGEDSAAVTCGLNPSHPSFDVWESGFVILLLLLLSARQREAAGTSPWRMGAQQREADTRLLSPIKAPSASLARQQTGYLWIWRHPVAAEPAYRRLTSSFCLFSVLQEQWCCFWSGSPLLWIIHLMTTKLLVNNAEGRSFIFIIWLLF